MPPKRSFRLGNQTVDIPNENADAFLKKYPHAQEVRSFTMGKDTVDIPIANADKFLAKYPNAKTLGDSHQVSQIPQTTPQPSQQKSISQIGSVAGASARGESASTAPFSGQQKAEQLNGIAPDISTSSFWNPKPQAAKPLIGGNQFAKPITAQNDLPDVNEAIEKKVKENTAKFQLSPKAIKQERESTKAAIKRGDIVVTKNNQGQSVIKQGDDSFLSNFNKKLNDGYLNERENNFVTTAKSDEVIKHLNLLRENPGVSPFQKESKTAATGILGKSGEFLGENLMPILKGTAGSVIGAYLAPQTGGASVGAVLSQLKDMTAGGYKQGLIRNYNLLKDQYPDITDEEAYDKAKTAALASAAEGAVNAIVLGGGMASELPKPTINTQGIFNGISHAIKSAPSVLGTVAAGSVLNDMVSKTIGADVDANEIGSNAIRAAKDMAVLHFGIPIAMGLPEAIAKVPSYLRPQFENAVASASREQVLNTVKEAEANGEVPQGSTDNLEIKLQQFDQAKESIPKAVDLSEETKASITGKVLQKQNLQKQIDELKTHGNSFLSKIEDLQKQVDATESDINQMSSTNKPFDYEKDNLTGQPLVPRKPFVELTDNEKDGVVVPKEYGDTNVISQDNGDGEKTFTPVAYSYEKNGGLQIKMAIDVEGKFKDRAEAQAAADKVLAQHYYDNGLEDNLKPISENDTNTNKEVADSAGNKSDERQSTEKTQSTTTNANQESGATEESQVVTPDGFQNRIHKGGLALGSPNEQSHVTEEGYTYRLVGEKETEAIRNSGGVFSREGKQKGGNSNVKYWSEGDGKLFYKPKESQDVIRVKNESINPEKVVSAKDLEIWEKEQNKFVPFEAETTNENAVTKMQLDDFKNKIMEMAVNMKESGFEYRLNWPEISQKDREKGVADIQAGKDTAAARKVQQRIQDMYDSGTITVNRGRGNQAETHTFKTEDWFGNPLSKEELDAIPSITPLHEEIINREGITADNIDNFKNLFDGFPYDESDLAAVKEHLAKQSAGNDAVEPVSEQSPTSEGTAAEAPTAAEQPNEPIASGDVSEGDGVGIKHASTAALREKYGLEKYERNNATDAELSKAADEAISNGYPINDLIESMEGGRPASGVENFILKKYISSLSAELEKNPSDENIAKLNRVTQASDKTGSIASEQLRTRKGTILPDDSLASFFTEESRLNNDAPLTEKQKETVQKEHKEITEANTAYQEKITALEDENRRLKAEQEIKRAAKGKRQSDTKEKNAQDKKDAIAGAREALRKLRTGESGLSAVPLPLIRELAAIAPHVAKYVKALAKDGVIKLDEIITAAHKEFKDVVEDISEKDIRDIVAGVYNEKRKPRTELSARLKDIRDEAGLINKLSALQNGEQPNTEKKKIQRAQQIHELQQKIKNYGKEEAEAKKQAEKDVAEEAKQKQLYEEKIEKVKTQRIAEGEKEAKIKALQDEREAARKEREKEKQEKEQEYVDGLKKRLSDLENGIRERKEKKLPEQDNSEVGQLKQLIKEADKRLSAREATTKNIDRLETELKRLQERRDKEPKPENKKAFSEEEKNLQSKIEEERKKIIKEQRLSQEEVALRALITRNKNESAKVEEQLRTGNFDEAEEPISILENKELQNKVPELYKQAIDGKDRLIKAKNERELRLAKRELANRSLGEKLLNGAGEVLNVPRSLMSSADFSAPLRQGFWASLSNPTIAAKAFVEQFNMAVSKKRFDRWFYDIKETPDYEVSRKAGLYLADPHNVHATVREEAFMSNLSEKIPLFGKVVAGSERAYVGYLNKLRWDLWNSYVDNLQSQGKTYENSKEVYDGLAAYINDATGRGNITNKTFEQAAPLLNSVFFSPRLIASRVNLLARMATIWKPSTPKEVRVMYLKDFAKVISIGLTTMAIAKLAGADVQGDPRSSDFGKIKSGNTRIDVWGGFLPYIRYTSQILSGQTVNQDGTVTELGKNKQFGRTRGDVATAFARGKLAPIPGSIVDLAGGKDVVGNEVTVVSTLQRNLLPLITSDFGDAYKDAGFAGVAKVIPSIFGVGVSTYQPKVKAGHSTSRSTSRSTTRSTSRNTTR